MNNHEERLVELEIRYTHLERLVEELNGVLTESTRRISSLEKENGGLREMLRSLAPSTPESPDE